ncbi:MAG: hypothetical protein V1837_00445 [Candidatus Woesearchaeota archaeon]
MAIARQATDSDLGQLSEVYKDVYSKGRSIHDLLKPVSTRFVVCVENSKVVGGVAVDRIQESDKHAVFSFRHFALLKDYREAMTTLLREAERLVGKGKIEIHVSELETPDLEFYMKNGYGIEGELENHYSMGEKCFVLGKTV